MTKSRLSAIFRHRISPAIIASAVLYTSPAVSFEAKELTESLLELFTTSDRMVASAMIGAGDGLIASGADIPGIAIRIQVLRHLGPDFAMPERGTPEFEIYAMEDSGTPQINEALVDVYNGAYAEAISGGWDEARLNGYLSAFEMGYESRYTLISSIVDLQDHRAVPMETALEDILNVGVSDIFQAKALAQITAIETRQNVYFFENPDLDIYDHAAYREALISAGSDAGMQCKTPDGSETILASSQ